MSDSAEKPENNNKLNVCLILNIEMNSKTNLGKNTPRSILRYTERRSHGLRVLNHLDSGFSFN